eukprot:4858116-Pyramimonas_sp.AAC.1
MVARGGLGCDVQHLRARLLRGQLCIASDPPARLPDVEEHRVVPQQQQALQLSPVTAQETHHRVVVL